MSVRTCVDLSVGIRVDIDRPTVRGSAKRERTGGDEERDDVEEEREVGGDVQRVVEGQHQQISGLGKRRGRRSVEFI